jgi:hypothetical protein
MVSSTIYNRSDIKDNLSKLFTAIETKDYGMAKNAAEQLRDALLKYYLTRGINPTHFYELFESLEYDLLNASDNHFKKEIVYDTLYQIIQEIRTSTKDPLMRLKEIYDDVRHIAINIDKSKIPELLECFDEINQLKPELEALGGIAYNYYSHLMQHVGSCESAMLRVSQSHPSDALFTMLQDTFKGFYEAAQRVIAPPVRLEISRKEVFDIYKKGIPAEEISQATGISEEDLRTMIQKEEFSHQDEDEATGMED